MKKLDVQFISRSFVILFAGFTLFSGFTLAFAEPEQDSTSQLIDEVGIILEKSLNTELNDLEKYKKRIASEAQNQVYLTAAYNGYRVQFSSFWNLLLSEDVDIVQLQKSKAELKTVMVDAQNMFQDLIPRKEAVKQELEHLENQKLLVDRQLAELAGVKENTPSNSQPLTIENMATRLARVLKEKEALLSRLDQIYTGSLDKLKEIKETYTNLDAQFEKNIEQKKAKGLFERTNKETRVGALYSLEQEFRTLIEQLFIISDPQFWISGVEELWQDAQLLAVSFFFVLAAVFAILWRLRKEASGLTTLPVVQNLGAWHQMAAELLIMSIIPAGTALTIFLYSRLDRMVLVSRIFLEAALVIMILLACRWICRSLKTVFAEAVGGESNAGYLIFFTRAVAVFILTHGVLRDVLGQSSGLLILLRMTGAFIMFVWTLKAWRDVDFNTLKSPGESHQDRNQLIRLLTTKYVMLLLSGVSLMLDMIGYELLASHWVRSWIESLVVFFWWAIFLHLLQEWDLYYREKSHNRTDAFAYDDYPFQWLLIRAGQFCWMVTLSIFMLLIWGNSQTVLGHLYRVLALPLNIGNMQFSFLGAIFAGLVIIFTYALVRIWKWLFQKKFLSRSGMVQGLQESITTISAYIIWAIGLLIALHVFGLNTASLAVAFGALGIGIGFGLQNIVNNFISGIILLFERPIQVGDDVEVNGTWARVRKINVRSTVVQTYDNASLIIPNADFISNQVTNWSFKDKRIRRKISVGVAYGSDVELVRKVLLQVAGDAPNVLRYPKPDVLFTDFGDSALIFVLRLWTDIDHMLEVDTHVRFEVDKNFRENHIEISFPQRDIHIRSIEGAERFFPAKAPESQPPEQEKTHDD
ncbi:mechanosensitive ion channel domain-containing protein [Desulfobacter latus]|uniref:Mechanosensitive ion channel n=1 Tax=Desulfobacter latus TaxID=2292 RepID=A0A850SVG3_9BACT|nr:mechanosensitive ion channel domain-containing protein [Desulfobacter latus]NWH03413.1 mechanosensitive ion channel [Desulfobacter latus]